MSYRRVLLAVGISFGAAGLGLADAAAQVPAHPTAGPVETRSDALPPGILLDEEAARGLNLPPGTFLRVVFSPDGIGLTKQSEGWRSRLYNDAAGYCTIGYGHLIKKSPCDGTEAPEFLAGITEQRGEELLWGEIEQAEIAAQLLVDTKLDDPQYAAIVDFIYNVGVRNFQNSALRRLLSDGPPYSDVPREFNRWVRAGGKVWPGLQTRRTREIKMFFTNIGEPRGADQLVPEAEQLDILPNAHL